MQVVLSTIFRVVLAILLSAGASLEALEASDVPELKGENWENWKERENWKTLLVCPSEVLGKLETPTQAPGFSAAHNT